MIILKWRALFIFYYSFRTFLAEIHHQSGMLNIIIMYIFLDESGNFIQNSERDYFVIGSFAVLDHKHTAKTFRSWIKSKFPKKMRNKSEVKWSETANYTPLRLKTMNHISNMKIKIVFGYLLGKNIPKKYIVDNKIESGLLYVQIIGDLLEEYFPCSETEVSIFCDLRPLKNVTKKQFESGIASRISRKCKPNTKIYVQMIDSSSSHNIQIADWISGAFHCYIRGDENGVTYYNALKNKLLREGKNFSSIR